MAEKTRKADGLTAARISLALADRLEEIRFSVKRSTGEMPTNGELLERAFSVWADEQKLNPDDRKVLDELRVRLSRGETAYREVLEEAFWPRSKAPKKKTGNA